MKLVNVALFGYGYWGKNVLRNLLRFSNINIYVVERDESKTVEIKKNYRIDCYKSYEDLIVKTRIDAALICVPVEGHFSLAKQLLEDGVSVLCQKPLVTSVKDAEELDLLAKKNNVRLMTSFTYIYHRCISKTKELLNNDSLGKLMFYDSTRINLGLIQRDCDVIFDLFCHDAAILYYLTDEMPEYISATGKSHNPKRLIDIANVSLGYKEGMISHCHNSWISPVKNRTILFGGVKKMAVFDDCSSEQLKIYDVGFSFRDDVFDYRKGDVIIPKVESGEAIYYEIKHFFECVENNLEPLTNGLFSINVLRMLEAASTSIKENGRPIYF